MTDMAAAGDRRRKAAWPIVDPPLRFSWRVALCFALLCFAINYPGSLNLDALVAIRAGDSPGDLGNWHSPMLTWLWNLPAAILGQPAGALLVQASLFGGYAGFLPRADTGWRYMLFLLLAFGWRFLLAGSFGMIGKDIMLLGLLLLAVQATVHATQHGFDRRSLLPALAAVALSLAIKAPNFLLYLIAAAVVLPFCIVSRRHCAVILLIAAVLLPLAVPAQRWIDTAIFRARDLHPDKQIVLFDLAGIAVASGDDPFAAVPGWPHTGLPPVAQCHRAQQWDGFIPQLNPPCGGYARAYDRIDGAMKRQWLIAIATHPLAYLRHRAGYMRHLLLTPKNESWGAGGYPVNGTVAPSVQVAVDRIAQRHRIRRPIQRWHDRIAIAPARWLEWRLFRTPAKQVAASLGAIPLLFLLWRRRRRGIRLGVLLPAALAIGNIGMLFFFGVSNEGRYLMPGMALFYTALLAMIAPGTAKGGSDPAIAPAPAE